MSQSFLQPFISRSFSGGFTLSFNIESTYDWTAETWTVPLNLVASQIVDLSGQKAQLFAGARYYAEAPEFGPEWGLRAGITFLFPVQ